MPDDHVFLTCFDVAGEAACLNRWTTRARDQARAQRLLFFSVAGKGFGFAMGGDCTANSGYFDRRLRQIEDRLDH